MKRIAFVAVVLGFVAGPLMAEPTIPGVLNTIYGSGQTFTEIFQDELWKDLNGGVTAKGKWAGYWHKLGIAYYTSDGYAASMEFDTTGGGSSSNWDPGDTDNFDLDNSKAWAFTLRCNPGTWSSDVSQNSDGVDHMRTFLLDGVLEDGHNVYVICWDDQKGGGDRDFQDNISEIAGAAPVPVPGAVLLGMLGLSVVGVKLRKRA